MAGYGLKAYIFIQDLSQLREVYGRDESITPNCQIQIAFTPNTTETAEHISKKIGQTTVVQKKRSKSSGKNGVSVSDSLSEIGRALMTANECERMSKIHKKTSGKIVPGDMLIFVAGSPAIYGRQILYFQHRRLKKRVLIPAPLMSQPKLNHQVLNLDIYRTTLNRVEGV